MDIDKKLRKYEKENAESYKGLIINRLILGLENLKEDKKNTKRRR